MRVARIALALLAASAACSRAREAPPAPRPRVAPEPVVDAGARVAPPPPPDGPCALRAASPVDITAMAGRIDRMRVAAAGGRARVVAEVVTGPSAQRTVSVDVDAAGALSPPETLTVGARGARVVAAPVADGATLRTVMFGVRRDGLDAQDFDRAFAWVAGEARSPQRSIEVDEVAAASSERGWFAIAAGTQLDCWGPVCESNMRSTQGARYHPKAGYAVELVTRQGDALQVAPVTSVPCAEVSLEVDESDVENIEYSPWLRLADDDSPPPDRCRDARRQRPYDVAAAARGTVRVAAWRTPRKVTVQHLGGAHADFEGDIGAPAVALRGEELVAVWAQRATARDPYVLQSLTWRVTGGGTAPAPVPLATGAASAFAPSLAVVGDRLVLAWMEGDERAATVRVGAVRGAVARVVEQAVTVSTAGANARDPELATDGAAAWIAWSEYPGGRRRDQSPGRALVAPLQLP